MRGRGCFTNQSDIYLGIVAATTTWRIWSGRRTPPALVLTSAILFITITGLADAVVHLAGAGAQSLVTGTAAR